MDEVERRQLYNQACDAAVGITDENAKRALLLTLQLINALQEQIEDMSLDDC